MKTATVAKPAISVGARRPRQRSALLKARARDREERLGLVRYDLPSCAPAAATGVDRATVQPEPSVEELTDSHDSASDHDALALLASYAATDQLTDRNDASRERSTDSAD